jgi:hypothetical protein
MDLILLNTNFWFGLKPIFFRLYFEHDINVVSNDVRIITKTMKGRGFCC